MPNAIKAEMTFSSGEPKPRTSLGIKWLGRALFLQANMDHSFAPTIILFYQFSLTLIECTGDKFEF